MALKKLEPATHGRRAYDRSVSIAERVRRRCDDRRLWMNLLDNAIKFTAPKTGCQDRCGSVVRRDRDDLLRSRQRRRLRHAITPASCSASSIGCMAPTSPATARALPSYSASSPDMAVGSGLKASRRGRDVLFYFARIGDRSWLTSRQSGNPVGGGQSHRRRAMHTRVAQAPSRQRTRLGKGRRRSAGLPVPRGCLRQPQR